MNAATRAVLDYLRTQADVIATRADDVLIDAPDAVHRSRVATRRTRSALRTFTPLFKKTRTRALRDELVWHADRLGAPRDAEVLKERLLATLDALPSDHVVGSAARGSRTNSISLTLRHMPNSWCRCRPPATPTCVPN